GGSGAGTGRSAGVSGRAVSADGALAPASAGRPMISGSISTPLPAVAIRAATGGSRQLSVSKPWQLSQTGDHSDMMLWQFSQTHCGPRLAFIARASHARTTLSSAPEPRSTAAMIAIERTVG